MTAVRIPKKGPDVDGISSQRKSYEKIIRKHAPDNHGGAFSSSNQLKLQATTLVFYLVKVFLKLKL